MGRAFCLFSISCVLAGRVYADPVMGPYNVTRVTYNVTDERTQFQSKISVWHPTDATETMFISYAHGMFGGGPDLIPAYQDMLHSLASFGYVIAATHACNVGCFDDDGISTCVNLKGIPPPPPVKKSIQLCSSEYR